MIVARPCVHPGCTAIVKGGGNRCPKHLAAYEERQRERARISDEQRGSRHERGYGSNWEKVRADKLTKNPLCAICKKRGKIVPATVVHHIDEDQFNNDPKNLCSLCRDCHERLHKRRR